MYIPSPSRRGTGRGQHPTATQKAIPQVSAPPPPEACSARRRGEVNIRQQLKKTIPPVSTPPPPKRWRAGWPSPMRGGKFARWGMGSNSSLEIMMNPAGALQQSNSSSASAEGLWTGEAQGDVNIQHQLKRRFHRHRPFGEVVRGGNKISKN